MDTRRRPSQASISSIGNGLTAAALNLSLDARRELTLALLCSLPRDDIIAMNGNLSRMLQKDILRHLPSEVAVIVLTNLDLGDILKCRLVSRDWAKLCEDQGLWAQLCAMASPPIRPRHTTWADLTLHQQLSHIPRLPEANNDEASFEASIDDLNFGGMDIINGQGGLGGGGGVGSVTMSGGIRGRVWERGGYDPPLYASPHASSSKWLPRFSPLSKRQRVPTPTQVTRRNTPFLAVPSHLAVPTSQPQVNYKHLFILHDILLRRMRGEEIISTPLNPGTDPSHRISPYQVRPRTIDAISSLHAGGLYGHNQTIYAIQLISRRMTINASPSSRASGHYAPSDDRGPAPSWADDISSWRSQASATANRPEMLGPITGRDWLLTASRDQTLRLWQLSAPQPRAVKVFGHGHTGSVLCLAVTTVSHARDQGIKSSRRRESKGSTLNRLIAISGGSDGRLCLWDVEHGDGSPEKRISAHNDSVLCIRADDERIVSSSKDRTIKVFDVHTLERLLVIDCNETDGLHRGAINAVCLTKEYILSASGDKTLRIWSIHTGALLASVDAGTRGIASMDFSLPPPRSHPALKGIIVIGSSDASIKVFHLISRIPGVDIVDALDIIPPLRDLTLRDMLLHDDMDSEDGGEMNTDWTTSVHGDFGGEEETELRLEAAGQCWAACECPARANNPELALCTRCFNRGHTDLVRSVHLGEKVIISGSYDSTVKVWDRSTGRLLRNLTGNHSARVFSVAGDHMRIVSSGLNASISIWDFSEGLDTAFVEP